MAGHYTKLLKEVTKSSDKKIGDYIVLTKEEQRRINEWNSTSSPFPKDKCVHQLFESRAKKSPANLAIADTDGRKISYDELNRKANVLARFLQAKAGVGVGDVVGICTGRNIEMILW